MYGEVTKIRYALITFADAVKFGGITGVEGNFKIPHRKSEMNVGTEVR